MGSTAKRITERTVASNPWGSGDRVDEAAGVIHGVVLCGLESLNNRDYPPDVNRRATPKYEGAKVYFDHTDEKTGRKFRDWVGVVRGVACHEDGRNRGRIELFKTDPLVPKLLEAAKKCPDKFGMSHVAMCKTTRGANGRERVEEIESVESVDIVTDPATTKGLHEGRTVALTVKALCEALVKHPKVTSKQVRPIKRLGEMDGMGDAATAMDAPPDDSADPGDGVSAAFKAAIMAVIESAMSGDTDPNDALSKIKKLLASHGEVNGDAPDDDDDDDDMPKEGKRPNLAGVLKECADKGFTPDTAHLVVIADVPTAAGRAVLIDSLKKATEGQGRETPRSSPRAGTQTTRTTPAKESAAIPTDPKDFAKRYRE
jgi:hypothetical protein